VAPLSLSVSPCGLMICRDFFLSVDQFVDNFLNEKTPILTGLVLRKDDKPFIIVMVDACVDDLVDECRNLAS